MKRFVLLITILAAVPLSIYAQEGWVRVYGTPDNEAAYSIAGSDDEGYAILCQKGSTIWLIKIDSYGDTLWTRDYDSRLGYCIQKTSDSGYIITGCLGSQLLLLKTNGNGEIHWEKAYGNRQSCGYWVEQTSDKGYIVTGNTYWENSNPIWLLKTDEEGDTIWTNTYGYPDGRCVQPTQDGGYVIAARCDFLIIKVDSLGNKLWTSMIGNESPLNEARCIRETKEGDYIATGCMGLYYDYYGIWLQKLDKYGARLWYRKYWMNQSNDAGYSLETTDDGGYVVIGETETYGSGDYDLYLLKTDSEGLLTWENGWHRTYGGLEEDHGYALIKTSDGGYILVGETKSFGNGRSDAFILRVDSLGGGIPLRIEPIRIFAPLEGRDIYTFIPKASFSNISTEDYPYDLYCHCEIIGLNNHNYDYHDSVLVVGLEGFETAEIEFEKWIAQDIDNYEALFYITSPKGPSFPTDTMTRTFYWDPLQIEDQPVAEPGFEVINAVGREIVLRYTDSPKGFHAYVFDASGRKVDEVNSNLKSGTIEWGEGFNSGVYFLRVEDGSSSSVQKVVLIR